MNWRSARSLVALLIVCIVLAINTGIWIYLVNRSQTSQSSQWAHLPPSKPGQPTPTPPAGGLAFYPQGTNLNENEPGGPKGIGFRWIKTPQIPLPSDPSITDINSVTIDGITGQLYTQTSLGASITVIFPYKGGSFIMTADADSDVLIYAFQHMLESLKFM